ncbi:histidine phosphatase family protein [Chloroflexota bacterium]
MSRLLLVRHGNTKLNSAERFWGITDVELSPEGILQAERLRDRLVSENIGIVYTSNLCRARVTAEIISARHKTIFTICEELQEINFGLVEGLSYAEICQRYPDLAKQLEDWKSRPGFPGGESHDELNRRVLKFMPVLTKHSAEDTVLIVAHSGVLRLLICNLLRIPVRHWRQLHLNLGSLSVVETYPQGAILNLLNDISHLY